MPHARFFAERRVTAEADSSTSRAPAQWSSTERAVPLLTPAPVCCWARALQARRDRRSCRPAPLLGNSSYSIVRYAMKFIVFLPVLARVTAALTFFSFSWSGSRGEPCLGAPEVAAEEHESDVTQPHALQRSLPVRSDLQRKVNVHTMQQTAPTSLKIQAFPEKSKYSSVHNLTSALRQEKRRI